MNVHSFHLKKVHLVSQILQIFSDTENQRNGGKLCVTVDSAKRKAGAHSERLAEAVIQKAGQQRLEASLLW